MISKTRFLLLLLLLLTQVGAAANAADIATAAAAAAATVRSGKRGWGSRAGLVIVNEPTKKKLSEGNRQTKALYGRREGRRK